MAPVAPLAAEVRRRRTPAAPDNPFLAWERTWADITERSIDAWRDMRDAWFERSFHAVYGWLGALGIARVEAPAEVPANLLAEAPEVRLALARMAEGGYAEAVVRMMILLAQARGGVRRDRLVRSSALLRETEPFASMSPEARQALIRTQTVICAMSPTEALETLPKLLPKGADRRRALAAVEGVAGPEADIGEAALAMLRRIRTTLGAQHGNGRGDAVPRGGDPARLRAAPHRPLNTGLRFST